MRQEPAGGLGAGGAPDGGLTVLEIAVDMVVTGMVMTSMTLLVLMSVNAFAHEEDAARPERVAALELSRSAERMLASEQCANPAPGDLHAVHGPGALRSECLTLVEVPFPLPQSPPPKSMHQSAADRSDWVGNTWPGYARYPRGSVVCWMVEVDSADARPGTVDDPRDLECWYHDQDSGELLVAAHRPYSGSPTGTTDMLTPYEWEWKPYRVSVVTDRIESIGSAFVPAGTTPSKTAWRCLEGSDPDPESALDSGTALPQHLQALDCHAGIPAPGSYLDPHDAYFHRRDRGTGLKVSPGVAVLTVDLCVTLSNAELDRRTAAARLPTSRRPYGETCAVKTVTVSPGHK